jgi:hypothetical protein
MVHKRRILFICFFFALHPFGPWQLFSFLILYRVGRTSWTVQSRYLHTEQYKQRINSHTDIHASSGIRTHNFSVWAGEDSSYLTRRQRSHCDQLKFYRAINRSNDWSVKCNVNPAYIIMDIIVDSVSLPNMGQTLLQGSNKMVATSDCVYTKTYSSWDTMS